MDVRNSRYAQWLETFCRQVIELKPERIGVCVLNNESVMTAYYGEMCPEDKAIMAYHIQTDAVMDTVLANAKRIVAAAEDDGNEES